MAMGNSARSLRGADFKVCLEHRPGWVRGNERVPAVGEDVYCAGGEGTMIALHGKTGDGSRLVQIRLTNEKSPPFFAAASNILVRPG
jgi:hypothetical protein